MTNGLQTQGPRADGISKQGGCERQRSSTGFPVFSPVNAAADLQKPIHDLIDWATPLIS